MSRLEETIFPFELYVNDSKGKKHFIEDVVLRGNDYKKAERTEFVKKYFGKINGKTASENIYNEIIKFLEKGKIA